MSKVFRLVFSLNSKKLILNKNGFHLVLKVTFHIPTTFVEADQILLFQGGTNIWDSYALTQRHRVSLGSSLLAVLRSISRKYWKILHYAIIKVDIKLRDCLSPATFHVCRLKMHKRQICSHGFSGILSRNTFQNKCKQKTKSSNNTYKGVHFQENHRPRISSIFYNHLFYGAHMNRCFWFSKMSLKIFQYNTFQWLL